jgi:hypothetical protein
MVRKATQTKLLAYRISNGFNSRFTVCNIVGNDGGGQLEHHGQSIALLSLDANGTSGVVEN